MAVSLSTSIPHTGSLAVVMIVLGSYALMLIAFSALLINISAEDISFSMLPTGK
jgi:hypothetical protein